MLHECGATGRGQEVDVVQQQWKVVLSTRRGRQAPFAAKALTPR